MKFSIITVCRNSEKMLPKAMESLIAQGYKDYEWVVIDGASTDSTLRIAQSFSSGPSVVISEPDKGIYDAMNKGIANARGEYIFFLNSDDALHDKDVLSDVSAWLDQNPGIDFLYGDVINIKLDGNWLRNFGHVNKHNIMEYSICHQAIFAKRTLFKAVGTFDLRFKFNADYDWMIRVFRHGAYCVHIDRCMAFFSDGGAHLVDKAYTQKERQSVRLQYMGKSRLALRSLKWRISHRMNHLINGHAPGVVRVTRSHRDERTG
jgi:glycosyltransferase involved in cell wall biosynthesis